MSGSSLFQGIIPAVLTRN